jgi:fucose permease
MSGMQAVTMATISGAVVFGMTLALLGRLKLALAQRVQLGDRQVRNLLLALNVALIPLALLCGLLLDVCGARVVLVAGSLALACALVSLSIWPTYPRAFVLILLAGFGAMALATASSVLMPRAFFTPDETSASLNLGYVFLALGALVTPVLCDVLEERLEPRRILACFALLALVPALLAIVPRAEHWQLSNQSGEPAALFAEPESWLAALVLFFYAPLEAAISLWTFTFLAEKGQDQRRAAGLLSCFWGAFLVSRLLVALGQHVGFLNEWWDRCLIVVPPLLAAVILGHLAGASPRTQPRGGLILLGFLLGPVLPTLLGLVFRHVAPAEQGTAFGLVFAAGCLGSLVLSPLVPLRTRPPLQTALRLPIFLALLVTAVALVLGLMTPG